MAIKCPSCKGERIADFEWADDGDVQGSVCLNCFCVFDLVDESADAEAGKGKKIGHKANKYENLGKKLQTWHIKPEDETKPKKVKGGQ